MQFLLTPLREGRPWLPKSFISTFVFLLTPLREGRRARRCRRLGRRTFLLTPLREGRRGLLVAAGKLGLFLLTPLREGRPKPFAIAMLVPYFYSRPCGRGDQCEGTPLFFATYFYSRPCGRGDKISVNGLAVDAISTHAPAGGATIHIPERNGVVRRISTHAPAGGATAIFHKSVMRFCGKLPKDDTVLCLASFGFPRRDPKAVYLAWISCANLPQKCVRQGLALKDQGTSCFHEGLASHAFVPVLV